MTHQFHVRYYENSIKDISYRNKVNTKVSVCEPNEFENASFY